MNNKLINRKTGFSILIAVLMLVSIIASGCVQKPTGGGAPSFPISVGLDISRAPALGETAELTFTMRIFDAAPSSFNLSNFSGEIVLTEGLEYVSGNLSWEGDLFPNQTVQFKALVKAVKTGNWSVHAWPAAGRGDAIFLSISEDSAQMSQWPFPGTIFPPETTPLATGHLPATSWIYISRTPSLNQTAELTVEIYFPGARENPSVEVILPEGFELVSGNLKPQGSVRERETVILNSTIRAVAVGNWNIVVSGENMASRILRISVSENSSYIFPDAYVIVKDEPYASLHEEPYIPT